MWHNQIIEEHPDTGHPVRGLAIPGWPGLLELAASTYEMTGLGYLGVDIVLDQDQGPMLLELNARPGLNIQLANRAGLLPRLRMVEERGAEKRPPATRAAFAMESFGAATGSRSS